MLTISRSDHGTMRQCPARRGGSALQGPHARRERGGRDGAERRRLDEWLTRIEHSIKPSTAQNWRNYAAYYVVPYIGERDVKDIDGAVCDALYAKLLAEGRVKARPKTTSKDRAVHVRRVTPDGKVQTCRPYPYDSIRCYRVHAEDDPVLGLPIEPSKRIRQRQASPSRHDHAALQETRQGRRPSRDRPARRSPQLRDRWP
jgi:hypothetical protein